MLRIWILSIMLSFFLDYLSAIPFLFIAISPETKCMDIFFYAEAKSPGSLNIEKHKPA